MPGQETGMKVLTAATTSAAAGGSGLVDGTNCNDRFNDI